VAIGLVANACFVWITDIRLERQLAALRAAGDPISLAELAPKPIPPEKNAATYLRQAEPGVNAINEIVFGGKSCETWVKRWEHTRLMPAEGLALVRKALHRYPKVIPLLERAAACPDYNPQVSYVVDSDGYFDGLVPLFQATRPASRVLEWRANLLLSQGKLDEAVQSGLVALRLADHYSRNPTVVGYLVALTARNIALGTINLALQSGRVSEGTRGALDADLALQESLESYIRMVKGFRAIEADGFHNDPRHNFWLISRGLWNW
jgi:tetratricopeptide (TPR) repeat protein